MYDVSNVNYISNFIFLNSIRDLNPLYDVTIQHDYREKYYKKLIPLSEKYSEVFQNPHQALTPYIVRLYSTILWLCVFMYVNSIEKMQLLPWGGKITSESLRFFSPIVIWTTVASSHLVHDLLFSAFVDYYKVRI
jgi:phytochromobilin:ferredoxin oxidoreductase